MMLMKYYLFIHLYDLSLSICFYISVDNIMQREKLEMNRFDLEY